MFEGFLSKMWLKIRFSLIIIIISSFIKDVSSAFDRCLNWCIHAWDEDTVIAVENWVFYASVTQNICISPHKYVSV